jgi:YidC/Oxa1 family membrane protein insertase
MAGCLPIIPTIFVFFALYKSVFINIDMRHAPFIGYIKDLSAKDPLSILNGFGLFPWDAIPGNIGFLTFIAIGPLAILYGISMSLMYTLTPPAGAGGGEQAEMMQKMMKWMPWVFMFILAPFPAGLLLYWVWNNILSFGQQYIITRKFNVDTPVDKFFRKITGKAEPDTSK